MQVTNLISYEYAHTFVKMTLVRMAQTGHQMDKSLREFIFSDQVPLLKLIFILTLSCSPPYEFVLA